MLGVSLTGVKDADHVYRGIRDLINHDIVRMDDQFACAANPTGATNSRKCTCLFESLINEIF